MRSTRMLELPCFSGPQLPAWGEWRQLPLHVMGLLKGVHEVTHVEYLLMSLARTRG